VRNIGDKPTIFFVKDILLLSRKEEIGERITDFISDIREVERRFLSSANHGYFSSERSILRQNFPPCETGFGVSRGCHQALERKVFFYIQVANHVVVFSGDKVSLPVIGRFENVRCCSGLGGLVRALVRWADFLNEECETKKS
jgi:hypothetical protein